MPLTREQLDQRIEDSRILSELAVHPGWQIICRHVQARLDHITRAIMSPELDHERTQQLRFQFDVLRWVLNATHLSSPEQIAKWEEELAFQEKRDSMREQLGLPPLDQTTEQS